MQLQLTANYVCISIGWLYPLDGHTPLDHCASRIRSFRCKETAKIFQRQRSKKLPNQIHDRALRKLQMLDAASQLEHLVMFPGNQLEQLKGDRAGQHSIRINKQWRICFVWRHGEAHEVEIIDYH